MNKKTISSLMFTASVALSGAASAAITGPTTIDFTGLIPASLAGKANLAPIASGSCAGTGNNGCYNEDGMVVGIVEDTSNITAHVHREGSGATAALGYHSDSSGIYIRAQDSTAFSLTSMEFHADIIPGENPDTGPNDFWEILGFSTALNPGLDTGDGTNYLTRVAYQTVANGFDGILSLNSDFPNISAFWIHFNGCRQPPVAGNAFAMHLDNIVVNAVPAAVPVPAAVWLFGSGLMGLLSYGRKKAA